jgi:hypothetical protein
LLEVKMKKTLIIQIILMLSLVSALEVDISSQDSFTVGEKIEFTYSITSDTKQFITFTPHFSCPTVPMPLMDELTVMIEANQPYTAVFTDQVVEDFLEPQTCAAYVKITTPTQERFSKNFTIATNPSFDLTISLPETVFALGEQISIELTSEVNPEVEAVLTLPDGSSEAVSFPFSEEATQTGTFILDVTASKEGYKTMSKSIQFAVIEKVPDIQNKSFKETWKEYRFPKGLEKKEELPLGLIIITIAVIMILAVSFAFFIRAKRTGKII